MANHALRSIAIKNESVKTKYLISDGRKSKSQARLHFKMKKRGETIRESRVPPSGRPPRRYRRGNSHNSHRWIPASIKDVKRAVGHNIIQQWQTRWVSDPRSQHHKTIEKLVSTKSKFQCASRRKEILISKLRIGKCALNQDPFLLKRHPDGKCQVCPQEDENVWHFLMECPAQSVLREEIRTRTNLSEMSSMLSNPASVDLIFR